MDTRFWGPSGWKLLHSITNKYPVNPTNKDKESYEIFFRSLPFILPCIYCRNSLSDYYHKLPIIYNHDNDNSPLKNRDNLSIWLYTIHNLVNDKLRSQGLINSPNPTFQDIKDKYDDNSCDKGWNFIYAIVLNYPDKYYLITNKQKLYYNHFFNYLPKVLPDYLLATKINDHIMKYPLQYFIDTRDSLSKWVYVLEQHCTDCNTCFSKRCREIEQYRAGCKGNSKDDNKPTCRRIKNKD